MCVGAAAWLVDRRGGSCEVLLRRRKHGREHALCLDQSLTSVALCVLPHGAAPERSGSAPCAVALLYRRLHQRLLNNNNNTHHESYAFQPNDDETDGIHICQRSQLHRSRLCHLHGAAQHGKVIRESSSSHLRPRRAHSQSLPREVARHKAAVSHLSCFCSSSGGVRA